MKRRPEEICIPESGGGLDGKCSLSSDSAGHRRLLVGASVTAWTSADAQLDRLASEHVSFPLQGEDDLDRTPAETTHA